MQSPRLTAAISMTALLLAILALAARLLCLVLRHDGIGDPDSAEYLALAQSIRFHAVFSFGGPHAWGYAPSLNSHGPFVPTAARAPLYPLLIAALWWTSAPPIFAVEIAQVVIGTLVCVLTYFIALTVANYRSAVIAGLFTALAPLSCFMTTAIMSETLFTFLMMSGLWFWSGGRTFLAGIFFGFATLTRPIVLPFVLLVGLSAIIFQFNRRAHAKIVLGAFLVVAPWTIRNAVTQHALIPIQTQGWAANLLFGTVNVPYGANGNQWAIFRKDPVIQSIISSSGTETEAERAMLHAALERMRSNPVGWIGLRIKEFPRLFADPGMYLVPFLPVRPPTIKYVMIAGSFLFICLSGLGVISRWRKWREYYFLAVFPIFMCVVQFPAYGEPRFMIPVFPMLAIFAALPLCDFLLCSRVPQGRGPSEAD